MIIAALQDGPVRISFETAWKDLCRLVMERDGVDLGHPRAPFVTTIKPVRNTGNRKLSVIAAWHRDATFDTIGDSLAAAVFGEVSGAMERAAVAAAGQCSWASTKTPSRAEPPNGAEGEG